MTDGMTDEHGRPGVEHDEDRRRPSRRPAARDASAAAAVPAASPCWWSLGRSWSAASTSCVTKGVDAIKDQFGSRRGLSRARHAARSPSRSSEGDTHRRDRPRPEGRRAWSPRSTRSPTPRPTNPESTRHPGRLLRAAEGDDGRRRARRPGRPGQPGPEHRRPSPRGCGSTTSSTILAKKTDFTEGRLREGRSTNPEALGLPDVRRGQPGGLPVPGDLRLRPEGRRPSRHAARRWSTAGSRRPTTPTSRAAAEDARLHARPS